MSTLLGTLLTIFQLPIMVLNVFGFIVSGIWLLVIGQWLPVVGGLLLTMFAPWGLGLALLPRMAFSVPGIHFAQRGVTIGVYFFAFLSSIYAYAIVTIWCTGITYYYLQDASARAFWPLLIWSYGIATSPWTYMAQRDGTPASMLAAFFVQVGYITVMVCLAFGFDLASSSEAFTLVMLIGIVFQMQVVAEVQRTRLDYNL